MVPKYRSFPQKKTFSFSLAHTARRERGRAEEKVKRKNETFLKLEGGGKERRGALKRGIWDCSRTALGA